MSDRAGIVLEFPTRHHAFRARCFHPRGHFIDFTKGDVEQSIPDRFEQMVRTYPDRPALEMGDHVLTYSGLNAAANRMARALLAQHAEHTEPVGVLFEKGVEQTAAMLAVLKAGHFFVLLNPSFPEARLAAVLEESQTQLIVADRHNDRLAQELTRSTGRAIALEPRDGDAGSENLHLPISPTAPAYINFTSGSTGQPKGVFRDHRSCLHYVMLYTNAYHLCEADRLGLMASGTGRAINDTFMALFNGAAVLPFDFRGGVTRLPRWLAEERISIWSVSSPLFRSVCTGLTGSDTFPDLRLIRLGSEAAYRSDVEFYKTYFPSTCLLANGLTSGETGLLTSYLMDHTTEITGTDVPVGYTVEDKEIVLLDDSGSPVGVNEVGEIVVRSRYLARGYWRRPELTRAKFRPDPEGGDHRVYLTGDLGLMLPDGCLIHKGRKDFRVKVRGYGVELAEVEKVLRDQEGIGDAVVVARENQSGEARLVAYFTAAHQPSPSASELRALLAKTLPDYMIPAAFVRLEAIPLAANGKTDRRALPLPDHGRPELAESFVAPRDMLERRVTEIWEAVLDLHPIGVRDNFFDLGGHSLAAARLCDQIEKTLGKHVPPTTLFHAPDVEQLTNLLRRDGWAASESSLVALQSHGPKPPFFWVNGELSNGLLPRYLGPDQPLYGLVRQSRNGERALHTRIEDIAASYLREIRTVQPEGPYFLGGFCNGGMLAFEMAQQLRRQGQQVALLALLDPVRPRHARASHPSRSPIRGVSIRGTMRRIIDLAKTVACGVYVSLGYRVPPALRNFYIQDVYWRAGRRYVPRLYPGRVIVLKTAGRSPDPRWIWDGLAGGGLESIEVPGTHTEIVFKEPQIQGLAKHLKACIDRAQAGHQLNLS